jgi:hypothetical protein
MAKRPELEPLAKPAWNRVSVYIAPEDAKRALNDEHRDRQSRTDSIIRDSLIMISEMRQRLGGDGLSNVLRSQVDTHDFGGEKSALSEAQEGLSAAIEGLDKAERALVIFAWESGRATIVPRGELPPQESAPSKAEA